jgi:hypothetical protein
MRRSLRPFAHILAFLVLSVIAGCNSSERFARLTAHTDLPAGTVVTLEAHVREFGFQPLATAPVEPGGAARYSRLLPGEYRLVVYNTTGQALHASLPFGVTSGDHSVPFITATTTP